MSQREQEILHQRAVELARPEQSVKQRQTIDVVEFRLAGETYAFELKFAKKVLPASQLVALPGTPAFVAGITHFSGQILSVIDLRSFFDLAVPRGEQKYKLVVLAVDQMQLAIVAEEILGVREIDVAALQEGLPTLTGVRSRYLKGVCPQQTIVLDVPCLVGDEALVVDQVG